MVIRHRHSAAADDNSTWGERKCDGQGKRDGRLEAAWHHRLVREKATHSDEHEHDGHDEVGEEGEPEDLRITLRRSLQQYSDRKPLPAGLRETKEHPTTACAHD